jgi:hypothetical protein
MSTQQKWVKLTVTNHVHGDMTYHTDVHPFDISEEFSHSGLYLKDKMHTIGRS